MIVAIGISSLILVVAIGAASIILGAFRSTVRVEAKNAAYFVAEGGVELALYDISKHGSGYEVDPGDKDNESSDSDDGAYSYIGQAGVVYDEDADVESELVNRASGWWEVKSLSGEVTDGTNVWYQIPRPGEGTAGENSDWNKINLNTSASIDLHRDISDPGDPVLWEHFHEIGSTMEDALEVRLRLPEGTSELDTTGDGVVPNDGYVEFDPTIVGWIFSGYDAEVGEDFRRFFFANDSLDQSGGRNKRQPWNTEITASKLNNHYKNLTDHIGEEGDGEYTAFDLSVYGLNTFEEGRCPTRGVEAGGCPMYVEDFTALNSFFYDLDPITTFQNLKLSQIGNMFTVDGEAVEHLEYQIVSKGQIPDAYVTIISEGVAGQYPYLYRQHIETKVRQNSTVPVFDFVFLEE